MRSLTAVNVIFHKFTICSPVNLVRNGRTNVGQIIKAGGTNDRTGVTFVPPVVP